MAVTDLRRRELGAAPLTSKHSNWAVVVSKAERSGREFAQFAMTFFEWVHDHEPIIPPMFEVILPDRRRSVAADLKELFRIAFIQDENLEVHLAGDVLLWNWGWNQEIARQAMSQRKKRSPGLFIKAKRTRSPKKNFLYQRIPHR